MVLIKLYEALNEIMCVKLYLTHGKFAYSSSYNSSCSSISTSSSSLPDIKFPHTKKLLDKLDKEFDFYTWFMLIYIYIYTHTNISIMLHLSV